MQLICLGDIALVGEPKFGINWPSYRDMSLGVDSKILLTGNCLSVR